MKNAFLIGKQTYLRALEEEDLEGNYLSWLNDPEVTGYMTTGLFPQTKKMLRQFYESASADKNAAYFAIIDKETDKHIGNTQLYKIDWRNRRCEFGILIGDRDYWGKGICKEALQLLVNYAFTKLNLRKMCINVVKENAGAVKCYTSVGFKLEGEQKEMWFDTKTNKYVSNLWLGLTIDEYNQLTN